MASAGLNGRENAILAARDDIAVQMHLVARHWEQQFTPLVWRELRRVPALERMHCVRDELARRSPLTPGEVGRVAMEIAAISSWLESKWICVFDPDLATALSKTDAAYIPGSMLARLPVPAAAIVSGDDVDIWALDPISQRCLWVRRGFGGASAVLPIADFDGRAVDLSLARDTKASEAAIVAQMPVAFGRALYLCSEAPDLSTEPPVVSPKRRGLAAMRVTTTQVGARIGALLRPQADTPRRCSASEGEGSGPSPQPHLRRAHWHTYWTGPRDGERQRILRWLHPVLVNASSADEIATTVRPVSGGGR